MPVYKMLPFLPSCLKGENAWAGPYAPIAAAPGLALVYEGVGAAFKGLETLFDWDMPDLPLIP